MQNGLEGVRGGNERVVDSLVTVGREAGKVWLSGAGVPDAQEPSTRWGPGNRRREPTLRIIGLGQMLRDGD